VESARIIVITGDGLEHHYVTNKLAAKIPLAGIIVDHGKPVGRVEKIRKYFRRYTIPQLVSRVHLAFLRKIWHGREQHRQALVSVFGRENCESFQRPDLLHHVHGINTADGIRTVASFQPDVILVYGTGIVGGKVLSQARTLALNMHTGISPNYRGCDCAFWPLYNGEPNMVGATVHECVKEVDGGRIFGIAHAELHADDNLFAVFGRAVTAGADLYVRKVEELLQHGLQGAPQDFSIGMEYKAIMRDARAEKKVRNSIRAGMIRRYVESHPHQPETVPVAVAK
jgi:methionyl-tRNA formyltransferase